MPKKNLGQAYLNQTSPSNTEYHSGQLLQNEDLPAGKTKQNKTTTDHTTRQQDKFQYFSAYFG